MATQIALARGVMAMGLALASISAIGAPPSFKITHVFSNLDGSLQFIRLTESEGLNGQNRFSGLKLTSTHNGITKKYTFPYDLPTQETAHLSILVTASTYGEMPVVVGGTSYNDSQDYACCYVADYHSLPVRFVATDGATIDFAGVDQYTYSRLPTDGLNALGRDGSIGRAFVLLVGPCSPEAECRGEFDIAQAHVFAIEYYNAALDRYFLSASAPDIDALESRQIQGWERTGAMFIVAGMPNGYPGLSEPVCRFYLPPAQGDAHFLSASSAECAEVESKYPSFVKETDAAFYVALPDQTTGACPRDLDFDGGGYLGPVYRLWSQGRDSHHRYTKDVLVRQALVAQGYVAEGYGPDAVAFCVP